MATDEEGLGCILAPDQHRQIKTLATFAGMTMKEFILAKTLGTVAAGDALIIAQARGQYDD